VAFAFLATCAVYVYAIGCYENWHGISSYGNRFLVALTPIFVIGLALFCERLSRAWQGHRGSVMTQRVAYGAACGVVALLAAWNLGLIFQWGMHLIPERGPISWRAAAYNQVAVVPEQAASALGSYLSNRKNLMDRIEQTDRSRLPQERELP
jgi:hypothetical protein